MGVVRWESELKTGGQVEEIVEAVGKAVTGEIETELINDGHTHVLLLKQVRTLHLNSLHCT